MTSEIAICYSEMRRFMTSWFNFYRTYAQSKSSFINLILFFHRQIWIFAISVISIFDIWSFNLKKILLGFQLPNANLAILSLFTDITAELEMQSPVICYAFSASPFAAKNFFSFHGKRRFVGELERSF